ncbi:MAG: hypothetical protein V9E98_05340 [Candidatus Nanopelagicales bacterium]
MSIRTASAIGLAVVVGAGLGIPSSGQAGNHQQLTRAQLLQVGLHVSDLPASLRTGEKGRTSVIRAGRTADGPDICLKKSVDIARGPDPRRHVVSVIPVDGDAQQLSITATRSDIYQYRSQRRAAAAFDKIRQKARKSCRYNEKVTMNTGGIKLTADAKGVVGSTSRLDGVRGMTVLFRARAEAALPPLFDASALADRYSAYHLAGGTIVRVSYAQAEAVEGKASLNNKRKKYVRQTAVTIARRVLQLS